MKHIVSLEAEYHETARQDFKIAAKLFEEVQSLLGRSATFLHPFHLGLYRLRALAVETIQQLKSDQRVQFDDREFTLVLAACLNEMDKTAIHVHSHKVSPWLWKCVPI